MFTSRRKSANVVEDNVGGVGASIAAAMMKGLGGCVRKADYSITMMESLR